MSGDLSLKEMQQEWHGSYKSYGIGFLLSLLLTGLSFYLVLSGSLPSPKLEYTLVTLALVQAVVQLRFFLHLGQEPKPQWESVVFYFMVVILLIVVLGSLWIMSDLDARMMTDMPMMNHD